MDLMKTDKTTVVRDACLGKQNSKDFYTIRKATLMVYLVRGGSD